MKILVLDNFMHKDVKHKVICEYLETTKREWFGILLCIYARVICSH